MDSYCPRKQCDIGRAAGGPAVRFTDATKNRIKNVNCNSCLCLTKLGTFLQKIVEQLPAARSEASILALSLMNAFNYDLNGVQYYTHGV